MAGETPDPLAISKCPGKHSSTMSYIGINQSISDLGGYGEPPLARPGSPLTSPGPHLRLPPAETITGYRPGAAELNTRQLARVNRVAEMIARSWGTTAPFTSIRLTGYSASSESQPGLGQLRAVAVRDALLSALTRLSPGTVTRIRWTIEDRGLGNTAKVEIHLIVVGSSTSWRKTVKE